MSLVGYVEEWLVSPGDEIAVRVDDERPGRNLRLDLVRLAEANEQLRRARWDPVPEAAPVHTISRRQLTVPGAYATCSGIGEGLHGGFTFASLVLPTLSEGRVQTLLSTQLPDRTDLRLDLGADMHLSLRVRTCIGERHLTADTALALETWSWVIVAADPVSGEFTLACGPYAAPAGGCAFETLSAGEGASTEWTSGLSPAALDHCETDDPRVPDFVLAGPRDHRYGTESDSFSGRIEHPIVFGSAISAEQVELWARANPHPAELPATMGEPLAEWDFTKDVASFDIADASGNGHVLHLENLPERAMRGAGSLGAGGLPGPLGRRNAAIHFSRDSLENPDWVVDGVLRVPIDAAPGCYAVRASAGEDADVIPFFVRRGPRRRRADLMFIAPTATYTAYSNSRCWWERTGHEAQLDATLILGTHEQIVLRRPELGLSAYDLHADGQPVSLVSARRPNLDMRSEHSRREGFTSDVLVLSWLEEQSIAYDVSSDHEIDADGAAVLNDYPVVMLGTHPEYVSSRMRRALEDYVAQGGRVIVMGGNAFCWLVAFHPEKPWIMEVRKPDAMTAQRGYPFSERNLALTGEPAGLTDGTPMTPETFLGVSSASMGFDAGRPFVRTPESRGDRFSFVFDGVADDTFGRLSGDGGVVFQEWDNAEGPDVDDGRTVVLARSSGHSPTTRRFGAVRSPNHADLAITLDVGGQGAVLSFATMAWAFGLCNDDVSRITRNVIERFIDQSPL